MGGGGCKLQTLRRRSTRPTAGKMQKRKDTTLLHTCTTTQDCAFRGGGSRVLAHRRPLRVSDHMKNEEELLQRSTGDKFRQEGSRNRLWKGRSSRRWPVRCRVFFAERWAAPDGSLRLE